MIYPAADDRLVSKFSFECCNVRISPDIHHKLAKTLASQRELERCGFVDNQIAVVSATVDKSINH